MQWRRPVGNLHERSIREIWERSAGLAEVRELTVEAKRVVDGYGAEGAFLNFCPGNAETLTGDPLAVYDGAVRRLEMAREVRQAEERRRPLLPVLG